MTSRFVDQDIRTDEGFEPVAYPDPKTGGDPWTIGFGQTGPDIVKGSKTTLAAATAWQTKRRQEIEMQFDKLIPWWRKLIDIRQDVCVNMAYNMGVHGFLEFHEALLALQNGDWVEAGAQLLASKWASQLPKRSKRLAAQIVSGVRA